MGEGQEFLTFLKIPLLITHQSLQITYHFGIHH